MKTYEFDEFPYVDSFITLPTNTVMFRGIAEKSMTRDKIMRDYPMYLAPLEIAKMYGEPRCLRCITPVKLIDIRKLIGIMRYIFSTVTTSGDQETANCMAYISLAFGMSSTLVFAYANVV